MPATQYTWNPLTDSVIEETDGVGNVTATYTSKPEPFGSIISQNRGGRTSHFHCDALGSTRLLTNSAADVTDTFHYAASGDQFARSGTTSTPYQWIGQLGYQFDSSTREYYVRARNYQPVVACWTSKDPLWLQFREGCYVYVRSSPVILVDPSGMAWQHLAPAPNLYIATSTGDTLQDLAQLISTDRRNWVCIWPTGDLMKWQSYPIADKCATADVSNLTATDGPQLALYEKREKDDPDEALKALRFVFAKFNPSFAMPDGEAGAQRAAEEAKYGATPLQLLVAGGHCGIPGAPDNMIGGLEAADFFAVSPVSSNAENTLANASKKIGPPKCWFTRTSNVYGFGCETDQLWAPEMAERVLRVGSTVHGTTTPTFGKWFKQAGNGWISLIVPPVPKERRYVTVEKLITDPAWESRAGTQ